MQRAMCRYSVLAVLTLWGYYVQSQQQPMFTQYMFNPLVINPAYAGAQETFSATAVLRKQWVGVEGAPQTQTISADSPLDDLRNRRRPGSPISLGLMLFHDQIAITHQTGLTAVYAYRLNLTREASLSFGLQGGFSQLRVRYSELGLNDDAFPDGDISEWQPEFGAGVFFKSSRFYSGISAPQMLRREFDAHASTISLRPHYFLTMGYILDINRDLKLKPNMLMKSFAGEVFQFDLNCNVFIREVLDVGISWRSGESLGALMRLQLHPRVAFGYAYDLPHKNELALLSRGSHEIMLNYRVPKKKIRTINPRFF